MVIYFDCQPTSGSCCFRNNVLQLLRESGYEIYTSMGRYLKVDTNKKNCFGSKIKDVGVVFDDRTSWAEIKRAIS